MSMPKLDWFNWIRGLISALIHGGASAISAGIGTAVLSPKEFNLQHPTKSFELMGFTFLISGVLATAQYLSAHSVPDVITETTTKTIGTSDNPEAVKVTTVKQTEVGTPSQPAQ